MSERDYLRGRVAQVFDSPNAKRPRWTIVDARAVRALLAATEPRPRRAARPRRDLGVGKCPICSQQVSLRLMGRPGEERLAIGDHFPLRDEDAYYGKRGYYCIGSTGVPA